jgi:PHD/YefM family antitoxin component YafN of YafNO toxin-antitoxin module
MIHQLVNDEKFTNVQRAQAGLTRLFEDARKSLSFYRVMKNDQPLGVLVPNDLWQSLVEDIEALSSPSFRGRIARARAEKGRISSREVKKQLGL